MRGWLAVALISVTACQAPSQPVAQPTPSAVPVGATRVDALNAADAAYRAGDAHTASELYDRVVNTPPGAAEAAGLTNAIDGLARFRAMLALVAIGDEERAKQELVASQEHDANAPLTRLAGQFWDQYGMTAQLRAACTQLRPQVSTADATLATLTAAGVTVQSDTLCSTPGS
jgi:hypothetical protein